MILMSTSAKNSNTLTLAAKMGLRVKIHQEDICKLQFFLKFLISQIYSDFRTRRKCFLFPNVRCHCAPDFHGIHCATRSNDCSSGSNQELCGHGTCINNAQNGYDCICDEVIIILNKSTNAE